MLKTEYLKGIHYDFVIYDDVTFSLKLIIWLLLPNLKCYFL